MSFENSEARSLYESTRLQYESTHLRYDMKLFNVAKNQSINRFELTISMISQLSQFSQFSRFSTISQLSRFSTISTLSTISTISLRIHPSPNFFARQRLNFYIYNFNAKHCNFKGAARPNNLALNRAALHATCFVRLYCNVVVCCEHCTQEALLYSSTP